MANDPRPETPSPLAPAAGEESFRLRHEVLVRKARDASHQALFYLGLLARTTRASFNRAIDEYRPFALHQVRSLVRGIHLRDEAYTERRGRLAGGAGDEAAAHEMAVYEHWRRIFTRLEPDDLQGIDAAGLERDFVEFLELSGERRWSQRLSAQWLPDLFHYLRRRFAFFSALALVLWVAVRVEPVTALIQNEGPRLLLPAGLLLLPILVSRFWAAGLRRARPGKVRFWNLGAAPFRRFRPLAVAPAAPIRPWPREARLPARIFQGHLFKVASYLVVWLSAFLSLRALYLHDVFGLGGSSLTVFLILALFCAFLLLAYSIDFWDFLDPAPVRLRMLTGGAACLLLLLKGYGGREFFTFLFLAVAAVYLVAFLRNLRRPFFLAQTLACCALAAANQSGIKTHALAIWEDKLDDLPWQRLTADDWPYTPGGSAPGDGPPVVVVAASGGGSRAALYTGLTLRRLSEEFPEIAAQVQAISSVSGGSLANAAYVVRVLEQRRQEAAGLAPGSRVGDLDRVLSSDFLLPTLQGALVPGISRGERIEREWRYGDVGLGRRRLSTIADAWRHAARWGERHPPCPVPLFNSSTLDGHDVVVTPLARDLYTRPELRADAVDWTPFDVPGGGDGALTWVFHRDGIYGLEDLLPKADPLLSSAVRASANFPFGFPLVRIETVRPLAFSPDPEERRADLEKTVSLTDGGALSNSGMWPLVHLLRNRAEVLARRGVLLIVIDASKMPSYGGVGRTFERLWGTINDQAPIGQGLHRQMIDLLDQSLGGNLAVVQIDLVPRERYNVMTTWALDAGSRGKLEAAFQLRWKEEHENLRLAWERLNGPPPRAAAPGRWRRLPLD